MAERFNTHVDCTDTLITDFFDLGFQNTFRQYFAELGINVKEWDGLFREMNEGNEGEKNAAWVRTAKDGSVIGFILFIPVRFTSWFFEETCGFIREFWAAAHRGKGHGASLLALAERYFLEHGITTSILTTDVAGHFYVRHGYGRAPGCEAKNHDEVFVKSLR